ncbi:putative HVA22-like protein i-like [Capsicum annuum]|uniref:uncharacterized protein LOC107846540 n=1 Tax=Capsicum annuum TaxID=4072 RepID=UPI0007BEDE89|nr:uncharacterized protein LOC107846540 [Capsicum annuum]KAF3661790.1 putative HVA22-like protein i-like [Capsicum annuum]KAF3667839.1 putative HVA22-like protein i-like [Capsicum annuum]
MSAAAPENPLLHRRRSSATIPPKLGLAHQSSASTITTPTNNILGSTSLTNSAILPRKRSLPDQLSASTITTTTTTTSSSSTSASSSLTNSIADDYELFSIKPVSYTSLRDILPPSSINSPGSEISIRNRLVKQAAWAYLQPMATSPDSSSRSLFGCMFFRFPVNNPVAGVIELFDRCILAPLTRAVDWLLRAIWIRSSR